MLTPFLKTSTRGQRVRIACALMGVFGVVFAVPVAFLLVIFGKIFFGDYVDRITIDITYGLVGAPLVIATIAAGAVVWLSAFIKRNDVPVEGWGRPVIRASDALEHPDLLWAVRRVWESGYFQPGQSLHFTTIRDLLKHSGMTVTATQIRSELEANGCKVTREAVMDGELEALFSGEGAGAGTEKEPEEAA